MQDIKGRRIAKLSAPALCCPKVFPPSSEWDLLHQKNLALASAQEDTCRKETQLCHHHGCESKCLFSTLPDELLRIVIAWMDIPCLALLIRTSKSSNIARMAADDTTWLSLVAGRFNIATSRSTSAAGPPRSKSYGGSTWKAAYRSMSISKRLPKCRQMPRKNVVLAKGANVNSCPSVNMWVMLNHTDDCNTRLVPREREGSSMDTEGGDESSSSGDETPRERYVELRVCIQNTRSGFRTVHVDIENATVSIVGMRGISVAGVQQPRIIHKSSDDKKAAAAAACSSSKRTRYNAARRRSARRSYLLINSDADETSSSDEISSPIARYVTLKPFEFVVFTARVSCTQDMRFETDFLSRARCVDVPVSWTSTDATTSSSTRSSLAKNFDSCYAKFISEFEIWEHYMELPGSCLTLVDRSHHMSA